MQEVSKLCLLWSIVHCFPYTYNELCPLCLLQKTTNNLNFKTIPSYEDRRVFSTTMLRKRKVAFRSYPRTAVGPVGFKTKGDAIPWTNLPHTCRASLFQVLQTMGLTHCLQTSWRNRIVIIWLTYLFLTNFMSNSPDANWLQLLILLSLFLPW